MVPVTGAGSRGRLQTQSRSPPWGFRGRLERRTSLLLESYTLREPFSTIQTRSKEKESPWRKGLKNLKRATERRETLGSGGTPSYTLIISLPLGSGRNPASLKYSPLFYLNFLDSVSVTCNQESKLIHRIPSMHPKQLISKYEEMTLCTWSLAAQDTEAWNRNKNGILKF